MKNIIILIAFNLLIASNLQINAQKEDYIPLAVENAQWLVLIDYPETPFPDKYYGYKIKGDTIINDTLYKKVYKREFESVNGDYVEPYETVNEYLYATVRDDIVERKIYGKILNGSGCGYGKDYLLFDYNIQIGDTNDFHMCNIQEQYTVHDIFYGTFKGYPTRYFELETPMCYDYLLEGIGSESGLFEDPRCFENPAILKRYCIGTDEECLEGFLVSVNDLDKQKEIIIYPDIVSDFVNIIYKDAVKPDKIYITDIFGKTVIVKNIKSQSKINLSKLQNGMYFISFNKENRIINTQKIIKI